MATPVQMSFLTVAATGASYPLLKPCQSVRITNTDATNPVYISMKNATAGDVVTAPAGTPAPTAGVASAYLLIAAGQSHTIDASGYTPERMTHILLYSASAVIVNLVGTY